MSVCFSSFKTSWSPERRLSWVESNQKIFNKVCGLIFILESLRFFRKVWSTIENKISVFWIVTQTGVKTSHDGMIFRVQLCCSEGLFIKCDDEPEIEFASVCYVVLKTSNIFGLLQWTSTFPFLVAGWSAGWIGCQVIKKRSQVWSRPQRTCPSASMCLRAKHWLIVGDPAAQTQKQSDFFFFPPLTATIM